MRRKLSPSRLVMTTLLAAACTAAALPALATERAGQSAKIQVTGEGQASTAPDLAVLSLSVLRESETAAEALSANNTAIAEVLAALKEEGIAERDLQTSNFSVQPRYRHSERKDGSIEPPTIAGYQVVNTLTVKIRELSKLGAILDRSVRLGVNQGGNIALTNDDPSKTLTQARKAAVADAIDKAKTLAEAAGVTLGPIVEITETSYQNIQPQPVARMAMAVHDSAGAVPVAEGENSYSVTVNVTFSLQNH